MSIARVVRVGVPLLALIAAGALPASAELTVTLGGRIKLDMAFQDQINTAGATRENPSPKNVAFDKGPDKDRARARNDQFLMNVRRTAFNITATDAVRDVKLRGFIEVDFNGGADADANSLVTNSSVIRLRHAYGEGAIPLGIGTLSILAGQYWSAFINLPVINPPPTVDSDFNTQLFARQPQLKLTYSLPFGNDTLNLIAAVEAQSVSFLRTAPGQTLALGTGGGGGHARQEGENVPAFVGKVQWLSKLVRAEVAGVFSRARGIDAAGRDESEFVYGVQGTAVVTLGPLSLHGHADSMNGINRLANGSFADAVFNGATGPTGGVAPLNTVGLWGGAGYKLTPTTRLNGLYEIRFADASGHSGYGRGANATKDLVRQQALHVNLLQQFWQRFQVGIEYERQWIDAFRNNHGTQNIYHAAFWYFF